MTNRALLVMDVQRDTVDTVDTVDAVDAVGLAEGTSGYLPRLRSAIDGARAAEIPVIYVAFEVRPSLPDPGRRTRIVNTVVQAGLFAEGTPGTEIHPDVAPRQDDIVVTKRRGSAFSGSDLALVLGAHGIDHLVLTGIATSGVVLHTACAANDRDLALTVLPDACIDLDPEVHRVLTERLFPQWADVVPVADWLAALAPR